MIQVNATVEAQESAEQVKKEDVTKQMIGVKKLMKQLDQTILTNMKTKKQLLGEKTSEEQRI